MIKDITIGQYFPGESFIHKLDPRNKFFLTMIYMITIFISQNLYSFIFVILNIIFLYKISHIKFIMALKSLKHIIPIIIFTAILNIFFIDGNILFSFGFLKITDMGINLAILMSFRVACLIISSSLLTYTTSPVVLSNGIENILNPLKKIKVPAHEISMMMTIAIRFIPTLIDEADKIIVAQKSRGANFETGNIISRAKAMIPILIPLFVSAFRRAEELALALECRCYNGGEGRTKFIQLKYTYRDFFALLFSLLSLIIVIFINFI
ncbi:MAG: energy-coupling factor transporter transmembrane protein EcfT [Oscillospiraceae bacterium]|nr:energy-coupling factor transporter transmembrane protein EcfT [Oscillospiraceae bacterium]